MNNDRPQAFAIDVSMHNRQFLNDAQVGPYSLFALGLDASTVNQIFQESIRQIFDIMTPDFREFAVDLLTLPDFALFTGCHVITPNQMAVNALRESIKRLGMGIWMTLQTEGFFSQPRILIFEHANLNMLQFFAYTD